MPRQLKVYVLGPHSFIHSGELRAALGVQPHINQATVLVVAPSKKAAHDLAARTRGITPPGLSDREFRVADSSWDMVNQMVAAGLFDRERVLVTAVAGHPSADTIVDLAEDGTPTVVAKFDGPWIARTVIPTTGPCSSGKAES
jgi:hypothetical protein